MNERIRELAEQAGLHLDENGDIVWGKTRYNGEVEKFAMLILEECIGLVGYYYYEYGTDGSDFAGDTIKYHFGVE